MSEIRDPIYGFIEPSEKELKIINTSLFQRLRRIKQLAMAYLVYPGANHTRFDHSLGVYHVAGRMADKLLKEEKHREIKDIIRYSALLHDVGHGPFSHVSEVLLNKFCQNPREEKVHEQITIKLIKNDRDLNKILSSEEINRIASLLEGENVELAIMKEIVSGPLDADKIDYLLRDCYFCGVKYGIFDLDRLLNTLESYPDGSNLHLAVKYDGLNSLEQFVLAKYYMTRQVYRHKVRILSDAMIVRGLELGIEEDNIEWLGQLFKFQGDNNYLENYLKFYDENLLSKILSQKSGYAYEIFKRLYDRRLFKRIFSERLDKIPIDHLTQDKLIDLNKNKDLKKEIECRISELPLLKCDKRNVIANSYRFKSVKEMSKNDNEGKLMIKTSAGSFVEFQEESSVFSSISKTLDEPFLEVYAPVTFENQTWDKEKKLKELKMGIEKILSDLKTKEV